MDEYLGSLLDLPLQRLQKEPAYQTERAQLLEDALRQLASDNYRTILRAPEDVTAVRSDVRTAERAAARPSVLRAGKATGISHHSVSFF